MEDRILPRHGPAAPAPGIMRSDLLVINKIDLTPYVGASLEMMERDNRRMRRSRPFVFADIREGRGMDEVIAWIKKNALFEGLEDAGAVGRGAVADATSDQGSVAAVAPAQGAAKQLGRTSELRLVAERRGAATVLADEYYTTPLKVMRPFPVRRATLTRAGAGSCDDAPMMPVCSRR